MQRIWKNLTLGVCAALPLLAGALTLQIGNPSANTEAKSRNAAAIAQVLACRSSEKTTVTAVAIGLVDGRKRVIPLTMLALSQPGMYAVTREWPGEGEWVIKFVATNPAYKSYATGALIPAKGNTVEWMQAKNYFHEPNAEDVSTFLK